MKKSAKPQYTIDGLILIKKGFLKYNVLKPAINIIPSVT